jgi:F-type H+-transporting ATPase subunit delta
MKTSSVSKKYAKALFDSLSTEKRHRVDSLLGELCSVLKDNSSLWDALTAPVYQPDQKAEVLRAIVGEADLSEFPEFARFLDVLVAQRRIEILDAIAGEFNALLLRTQGIVPLTVVCALKQNKKQQDAWIGELEKVFAAKLSISWEVDPDLLGGFILKSQDAVLDLSVSAGLKRLERQLLA